MKKFGTFFLLVICGCAIGGCYGILHDQITYSISPEYYTRFKFIQFWIAEEALAQPRLAVAYVGFMATWWMGMFIGIVLGLIGTIQDQWKSMVVVTIKAFLLAMAITFFTGLIGLAYGYIVLADQPRQKFPHWFIPDNLVDYKNYIAVGSMHNFSYLGGLLGLVAGGVYSVGMKPGLKNRIFWWTSRKL